ncbi:MAG: cobalamin-binding protein [Nitrosomonadales bacterium]|nr:MAG: cobalamin-binding protein [Nitrosomonadales bacterium]
MTISHPSRIVCLTEETTETLYLLGEQDRIVGISGYTVRPPQARREKPKISAFTSAKIDAILDLKPDLVLGFSNLQGDIARDLIKAGIEVYIFNQRSVDGILRMVATLGALIGAGDKAAQLVESLEQRVEMVRREAAAMPRRPRVYFEEWDQPMISAIGWVSELIGIAGGEDCFTELGRQSLAGGRIIADSEEVVRRAPDIIIGSWCGKKFRPEQVMARPGWSAIPAVAHGQVFEIKSPLILQPGPAALTDGLDELARIVRQWAGHNA